MIKSLELDIEHNAGLPCGELEGQTDPVETDDCDQRWYPGPGVEACHFVPWPEFVALACPKV